MRTRARSIRRRRGQAGISYLEVLIATVLLVVSLLPALEALRTGVEGAAVHESLAVRRHALLSKLEEVLAQPIPALEAAAAAAGGPGSPTSYSDPPGTDDRRLVYLARYDADDADGDADPFTGGDAGLLWVRVAIEKSPHAIETLTSAD